MKFIRNTTKQILNFFKENWFKILLLVVIFWIILIISNGLHIEVSNKYRGGLRIDQSLPPLPKLPSLPTLPSLP